jgi:vacuolar-type H+-ATPase subunit H
LQSITRPDDDTMGGEGGEGGEVVPDELLRPAIPTVREGYAPDLVDSLLQRAAATIARLRELDEPALEQHRQEQAELLHRTLLLAQASADRQIAEARATAASLVVDAQARAGRVMAEAEQAASHLVEGGRAQARRALAQRQELERDIDTLERFADEFRARLRTLFATEAARLDRVLSDAVGDRPARREIDLTETSADECVAPSTPPAREAVRPGSHPGGNRAPSVTLFDRDARTA